jgi:hypothetical protein
VSRRAGVKMPAAFDRAAELARLAGWTVSQRQGSKHICWKPPTGAPVFTASTPSDYRGVRNALALLRRAGLEV